MLTNCTRYESLVNAIQTHNSDECLIWPFSLDADGYGRVWYKGKTITACRLVFFLGHNRWPNPLARHTCDTASCINPRHIIEGTHADNVADAIARGRFPVSRGEDNIGAKLTNEAVREIRNSLGVSKSALAAKFHVSRRTIRQVIQGKRWKHVHGHPESAKPVEVTVAPVQVNDAGIVPGGPCSPVAPAAPGGPVSPIGPGIP